MYISSCYPMHTTHEYTMPPKLYASVLSFHGNHWAQRRLTNVLSFHLIYSIQRNHKLYEPSCTYVIKFHVHRWIQDPHRLKIDTKGIMKNTSKTPLFTLWQLTEEAVNSGPQTAVVRLLRQTCSQNYNNDLQQAQSENNGAFPNYQGQWQYTIHRRKQRTHYDIKPESYTSTSTGYHISTIIKKPSR